MFVDQVHADAPSVLLELSASPEDNGSDVVVTVRALEGSFAGTLQIRRPDGGTYLRELEAQTCDELNTTLAFVAALAFTGQVEPTRASPPPLPSPPPVPERTASQRAALVPPAVDTLVTEAEPRWQWGGSLGLGLRTGLAPTWANLEQVSVELRSLAHGVLSPTLRLALIRSEPVTRRDRFGSTRFTWAAGRFAACPLRIRLLDAIEAISCAGLDVGVIEAAGTPSTPNGLARDTHSLWVDALGSARLQARFLGPIFLTVEAELVLPLTRQRFSFDPNSPVYAVPAAAGAGLAGLLAQFP